MYYSPSSLPLASVRGGVISLMMPRGEIGRGKESVVGLFRTFFLPRSATVLVHKEKKSFLTSFFPPSIYPGDDESPLIACPAVPLPTSSMVFCGKEEKKL